MAACGATSPFARAPAKDRLDEVHEQIVSTQASSFDVLLWQLEHARNYIEGEGLLDTIIAGVRWLAGPECDNELEQLLKAERTPRDTDAPDEVLRRAETLLPLYQTNRPSRR
jgi:hypothetical protein